MADVQNIWNGSLQDIREFMESIPAGNMAQGVGSETITISGVPCRVLSPSNINPTKTILYFHGGGFCLGLYPATIAFAAYVAQAANARVIVPDYRLAPSFHARRPFGLASRADPCGG